MTVQEFTALKKKFGKNLRAVRESKNMSLLDVSYNCGLDYSTISKIERGLVNPTFKTIVELGKGLEVHPTELLSFI
jgi:transcriptional regulator with XRE-family HTH domain